MGDRINFDRWLMARRFQFVLLTILAALFSSGIAEARGRDHQASNMSMPIPVGSPTLAPFQHVRFCLHYPADCKSDSVGNEQVELDPNTLELLKRVNQSVNASIAATVKTYGANLDDGWTIAPALGDCNDYAVTKRHELLQNGLPSKALRLAVVKTSSGIGHLILVVVTSKGDIVLDNLTEELRPWLSTKYQWLKIQSAGDAKFWYEIRLPAVPPLAQASSRIRLADR
jgi:predicted transglutaminase-like cysteine proteinase